MSALNVSAAARATGVHRVTIQKHIKNGKISASKDSKGNTQIDVAELIRVYGPLKSDGSTDSTSKTDAGQQQTTAELVLAAASLESLQKQLDAAIEREKWMQRELEEAREHNRELERRMLPPGEPGPGPGEPKKGFFRRLFG